jgi:hypothetical protein
MRKHQVFSTCRSMNILYVDKRMKIIGFFFITNYHIILVVFIVISLFECQMSFPHGRRIDFSTSSTKES